MRLNPESLARSSSRHPWRVVVVWVLIVVGMGFASQAFLADALTTDIDFTNNPESKQAMQLIEEKITGEQQDTEFFIILHELLPVADPTFEAYVRTVQQEIIALGDEVVAGDVVTYYDVLAASKQTPDPSEQPRLQEQAVSLVSTDGRATLIAVPIVDIEIETVDKLRPISEGNGEGGFRILLAGGATLNADTTEIAEEDLRQSEMIGIGIALVVLIVVFAAVIAAVLPLSIALVAIPISFGAIGLVSAAFGVSFSLFTTNIASSIGLAVGIDYSLFIIARYREERRKGFDPPSVIVAAGATARRAVFFSGMTVVFALLGMLIVPTTIFRSLAAGAIIVVIVSVLVSLTLLPAILGILGDKVNALRLPFTGRRPAHESGSSPGGFWDRVTRTVMRHPVVSLVATAALLIALAVPYIDIQTGSAGVATLPDNRQSKQGFLVLEQDFSFGLVTPAEIAIDGDLNGSAVQQSIDRLKAELAQDPSFGRSTVQVNDAGDLARFSVPVSGDPSSGEAGAAVERLRSEYIPRAFSGSGAGVYVTGTAARQLDYLNVTNRYTPIVVAFVLGLSFVLLTVVFRSLVVPLKAIIMNLLSVGA